MNAKQEIISKRRGPFRTTLLGLVHSLSDGDLTPDEVVRNVRDSIDDGRVVLIGNFREGLEPVPTPRVRSRKPCAKSSEARWKEGMIAAQAGDAEAYREFLQDLRPEIMRLVRAKLFDPTPVEDVVQNALLAIHRARHTYRPSRAFGPWMRTIVRNATIDHLRQARRRQEREADVESIELIPDPRCGVEPERNERCEELARLLAELPTGQREAIEMMQLEGLSAAEAARRVGISAGALRLRAHRGYCAMRARLKEDGEGSR